MMKTQKLVLSLATLFSVLVASPQPVEAAPVGAITQLPGTAGCISDDGTGGECETAGPIGYPYAPIVSPDGKFAYVSSYNTSAVLIFSRDVNTGALTQLPGTAGCISETGSGGTCEDVRSLGGAFFAAMSPDGAHLYVGAWDDNAVAAFSRDADTGALTQLSGTAGCISETGSGGLCTDGKLLAPPVELIVSPDGLNVYVAAGGDALSVLSRNASTGALTQLSGRAGCVSETGTGGECADGKALLDAYFLDISPDGANVYVASITSEAVAVFSRNQSTGALTQLSGTAGCISETGTGGECTDGHALDTMYGVEVSPDGANVYSLSYLSNSVAVFSRDKSTGALTQLSGTAGCISETGSGGECADGKALVNVSAIEVSPDGANVYVTADTSSALAIFSRDQNTGALTQLSGTAGCISETGTGGECVDGKGLVNPWALSISPDGKNVYTTNYYTTIAVFARQVAPTCSNVTVSVVHNTSTSVSLSCTDPNGDGLTYSIVSGPTSGTLGPIDQATGTVAYTPNAGFSGNDSFAIKASDGSVDSNSATVNLAVASAGGTAPITTGTPVVPAIPVAVPPASNDTIAGDLPRTS